MFSLSLIYISLHSCIYLLQCHDVSVLDLIFHHQFEHFILGLMKLCDRARAGSHDSVGGCEAGDHLGVVSVV